MHQQRPRPFHPDFIMIGLVQLSIDLSGMTKIGRHYFPTVVIGWDANGRGNVESQPIQPPGAARWQRQREVDLEQR